MNNADIEEMTIEDQDFLFILDSRHKKDFTMNFHRHNFFELSFVMDGEGFSEDMTPEGLQESVIRKDNIILRDGRAPHKTVDKTDSPLEQLIIIFDEIYLQRLKDKDLILTTLTGKNPLILSNTLHTAPLKPLFRDILNEIRARETGRDSLVFSILGRLLIQILRTREESEKARSEDLRINRALDYIHSNFYMNITIQSAAAISALSHRQFSDVFKRETGRTFTQYLNYLRIEKAKSALTSSRLSITEIAFEIGYDDLSYFTRRFKAQEGMSPRAYKKQFGK